MQSSEKHKQLLLIFLLYTIPLWLLLFYNFLYINPEQNLIALSLGVVISCLGSCFLYLLLPKKEAQLFEEKTDLTVFAMPQPFGAPSQHKEIPLEKTCTDQEHENLKKEYLSYRESSLKEAAQSAILLKQSRSEMDDMRFTLEKKKQEINALQSKIEDLKHEIKALLEVAPFSKQRSFAEICEIKEVANANSSDFLKRALDIAQKFSGPEAFSRRGGLVPRFSNEHFALDQRRFFDSLSSEAGGVIFVYSKGEGSALFVSEKIHALIGLESEKFIAHFNELIGVQEGFKAELDQLPIKRVGRFMCRVKNANGQLKELHCDLGLVPTGAFRGHILGVLQES
jgi:cell division protein FtsB